MRATSRTEEGMANVVKERTAARTRYLERRKGRARRQISTPRTPQGFTRSEVTELRTVKRKLKAGRPGRPSNAPRPTFDWENVIKASQRKPFGRYDKRRSREREWA